MSLDPKKTYIPSKSEKPFPGLAIDWYNGQDVIVYKMTAVSEEIITMWAEYVQGIVKQWDKQKPYLAIHDLSKAGVSLQFAALVNFDMMNIGITMGGRLLCEQLFDQHEAWSARVAINFNLSLSGQTNRTLMNYLNREHPSIAYKTFYNRSKCLRWLSTGTMDTSEMKAFEDSKEADNPSDTDAQGAI